MRPVEFQPQTLRTLLAKHKVATMEDLKRALGTTAEMTVVRKLRVLGYLSSYSQRGKFYTLRELAPFDTRGLFAVGEARFSRFGSLVQTAEHFVVQSRAGYLTAELNRELGVETKEALLTLVRADRVVREKIEGLYVHCAPDPQRRAVQIHNRKQGIDLPTLPGAAREVRMGDEARAALVLFFATLDEHQRRLYAGLESLRVGHGGDRRVAELTGLNVHTVARGRQELLAADFEKEGVRREGAGREAVEKKRRK